MDGIQVQRRKAILSPACAVVALSILLAASGCQGASYALELSDFEAVCRAVEDLQQTFGDAYPVTEDTLATLREARTAFQEKLHAASNGDTTAARQVQAWCDLARTALLANPLLEFDDLLLVKRSEKRLGLPQNWEGNSSLPLSGFDNEIALLSLKSGGPLRTLYRPEKDVFVGDLALHWDADRLLFSMPGSNGRWQVHELTLADGQARELTLIHEPDVDNYEACYLPDDAIIFASTAPFVGVPCVTGSSHVSNLYRFEAAGNAIRRLTFEQDHNWCPRVMHNGRILYLRWEYSDIPHFASRILFHMNPDGTGQMEYYGSNSYWPNAMFYARPIPGHPTKVVAIVGGHHGVPRMGELVIFDPALGRREADGVVQRIPGYGKPVEPILEDNLVDQSWPRFLHPWPLSEKYFLVSCKPSPDAPWGLYLADIFDNLVLLREEKGVALFEPVPVMSTLRPPALPNRVDLKRNDATVLISDVYTGDGLKGVPRGTVKQLRLFTYHFAYHGMGGQINRVGLDGPWDIKRVLGTVPVEDDGSAYFRVPANTPVSVQPLDENGQALQLMRSWMTAMPGETMSCVGCHESQNTPPPVQIADAARRAPSEIAPWYGPVRGFSFRREVQPVLDHYCVGCHNGTQEGLPDFRDLPDVETTPNDDAYRIGSRFPPAYLALRRHVRGHTMESDLHMLTPLDFHAGTTELVQHLRAGHKNLELDPESWDRIITWIDLNTPAHGTWQEIVGCEKVDHLRDRRMAMQARYAQGVDGNPEEIYALTPLAEVPPATGGQIPSNVQTDLSAPKSTAEGNVSDPAKMTVMVDEHLPLELVRIPAGTLLLGTNDGYPDEGPPHLVEIEAPFWMGATEITNALYALFDPDHDSRLEHGDFLQFSTAERGWRLDAPEQPVVRVSWERAMAFCDWLSARTGKQFTLPTEAQWEYACRAGTEAHHWYGNMDADFSPYENLADMSFQYVETLEPWKLPSGAIHPWRPARADLNDGHRVSAPVGRFAPNPWGLHDMHGNVAEWTLSLYAPYPFQQASPTTSTYRVVRGGAWSDRPHRARASIRRQYPPWQSVYNVGFRVVCQPATD